MHPYVADDLTAHEAAALAPFVTNTDRPVFALTNMPEVVKGALFARYSRSPKSLRRLLLDEFADDLEHPGPGQAPVDRAGDGAAGRAERLYQKVFDQYGDDSVAQLGGAHAAVEQASNLLTKVLEWGRLAAYLEQSTRYIAYDDKPGGRYRYYRDPEIMASEHAEAYETELDAVFDGYAAMMEPVARWARARFPQEPGTSDGAYRAAIRAKTCDLLRGLLPAATVSNVGIYASGQSYERLLLRLAGHPLAEARHVGDQLLTELRHVIPSFLVRVDRPDRGGVWADYLADTRDRTRVLAEELLGDVEPEDADDVTLIEFDPDAETDVLVGMLYPHSDLPDAQLRRRVRIMEPEDRRRVVEAYVGQRTNRRHKPGRALERARYGFDIVSDYGAFRDLQRHRMLSIQWQDLSPQHGYVLPPELEEAGVADAYRTTMMRQAYLWQRLYDDFPVQSQYAVGLGWRMRYTLHLNARAAMQMLELRTSPQGHPSYRHVCQEMHRLIGELAGHRTIAGMMSFVDHGEAELERLDAERAAEARRAR